MERGVESCGARAVEGEERGAEGEAAAFYDQARLHHVAQAGDRARSREVCMRRSFSSRPAAVAEVYKEQARASAAPTFPVIPWDAACPWHFSPFRRPLLFQLRTPVFSNGFIFLILEAPLSLLQV